MQPGPDAGVGEFLSWWRRTTRQSVRGKGSLDGLIILHVLIKFNGVFVILKTCFNETLFCKDMSKRHVNVKG